MSDISQSTNGRVEISDEEIQKFCEHFHKKTGIYFNASKRYFLEKRILKRIHETKHKSFRSYFSALRFAQSRHELQSLINLMTINETYFFRESHQFDALIGNILDEIPTKNEPIVIWSMPCSTGEEPYSIAIKLLEEWPRIQKCDVQIIGSDIDTSALTAAQQGVYSQRSISKLPVEYLQKYFTEISGNRYKISENLTKNIEFSRINVSDQNSVNSLPKADIIFCRNMLIYFDENTRRQVINDFFDKLNPGGYLMLGHSESISRSSSLFRARRFGDCIAYQKES